MDFWKLFAFFFYLHLFKNFLSLLLSVLSNDQLDSTTTLDSSNHTASSTTLVQVKFPKLDSSRFFEQY